MYVRDPVLIHYQTGPFSSKQIITREYRIQYPALVSLTLLPLRTNKELLISEQLPNKRLLESELLCKVFMGSKV